MKPERLEKILVQALLKHLGQPGSVMEIPEAGELVWTWFLDLHQSRTMSFHGPNPIEWSEMLAYSQLAGWRFEAHHIRLIRALDQAYLDFTNSQRAVQNTSGKAIPRNSGQEIHLAAFDATFG